jgi:hypothetical protein
MSLDVDVVITGKALVSDVDDIRICVIGGHEGECRRTEGDTRGLRVVV